MDEQEVPTDDMPDHIASGAEVPKEDMPESPSGSEVPAHDLPESTLQGKYATPGQQAETGFEGLARGVTGGLSDALAVGLRKGASAIGVPDEDLHYVAPDPEDMAKRETANPIESGAAELAGNVGLLNKLPQMGSKAINGMIQMGLISAGDEVSKAMLGTGDPIDAAAMHIAGSTGIGLLTGGLFGKLEKVGGKALQSLENSKIGSWLPSFLSGVGHAASFPSGEILPLGKSALTNEEAKLLSEKAFQQGQSFFNSASGNIAQGVAKAGSTYLGSKIGGLPGAAAGLGIEHLMEKIAPNVSKKIAPAILKAAASEGSIGSLGQVMGHATTLNKGSQKISRAVESLFNAGGNEFLNFETSPKEREKLRNFVEDGKFDDEIKDEQMSQTQPEGFASGGKVDEIEHPNALARIYPEQNILLTKTKGSVNGYLNSVRPQKIHPKLPFDTEREDPSKDREYDKVLDLANQPLSILKHVKKGTLQPKHMTAFTNMYPDLYSHLSKKITEKMMNAQLDEDKKPPRHVRQSLSLFLGSNLMSSLTQPNIAAAQNVFAQQNAQKAAAPNSKSSLSKLGEAAQTPEQARTQRLNKG